MSGFAQASHIFGVRQNVVNAPLFADEHTLLLPAGGQMVRYRLDRCYEKRLNLHFWMNGNIGKI